MQNSELFRRGVVVPLDADAEERLRFNCATPSSNVRHLSIPDERLFQSIWNSGIFRAINARCGSSLDDYEEETLEASAAVEILAAIASISGDESARQPEVAQFLKALRELVKEASAQSRPILFVL